MSVLGGLSVTELDAARRDPVVFANVLLGQPLWRHQLEVVRSPARYRVICAGRRAGKSRVFGVLALHTAFVRPGSKILIVAAGEKSAKRLFREISGMARSSPLLAGSVVDELTSSLRLSTGSVIECVPSSHGQVRSAEADLLIVDEAGFVPQDIWEAAEPVVLARPGSRVLICSTPWGAMGHFFRTMWRRGMSHPDELLEAWHWPSTVSPLVDEALLASIRERSAPDYFAREYLAEWTDDGAAYFPEAELTAATVDYALQPPEVAEGEMVVAGVDWGFKRDANALVLVGVLDDGGRNDALHPGAPTFYVPWLEQAHHLPYADFVDRVVEVGSHVDGAWSRDRGYTMRYVLAEENGPGEPAVQALRDAAARRWTHPRAIQGVWTTNKLKVNGYGALRLALQQGRMVLPNHPELLKQLHALTVETLRSGAMRIEVPSNVGHDDLADALMQAMASVRTTGRMWAPGGDWGSRSRGPWLTAPNGVQVPTGAVPLAGDLRRAYTLPRAGDADDGW